MRQRLDELTVMRAIACLSVLVVHISAIPFGHGDLSDGILVFFGYLNRAFKFTTPVFVFLSGIMQYYHQWQGVFSYKKFMKKRFGPIFWPYLVAVIGYELILGWVGVYPFAPLDSFKRFILGDSNYHLYFVVIILQLYLLMPLVLKLYEKFKDSHVLLASLVVSLLSREFLMMPYSDRFFLNYLFFFMLGAYVVRHMEKIKKILSQQVILLSGIYIVLSGIYGYQFVLGTLEGVYIHYHMTSMTWFVFVISAMALLYGLSVKLTETEYYKNKKALKAFTQTISTASYWIYLIHPMVLYVSTRLYKFTGQSSIFLEFLWNMTIVFGAMIVFAYLYPLLLNLYKRSKSAISSSFE